jgi:signal transduction histidine kinase
VRLRLDSVRGRLIAGLLFVFSVGAVAERPLEDHITALGRLGLNLQREPYQDILMLIPLVLGAVALIWLVSAWSLRHLASASREVALVRPSAPFSRISTKKLPREIRPLVDAVNGALQRLAEAYETERRFVADAAHALRTPLTVLSLHLQRAKVDGAAYWSAIDQDLQHVTRLVDQLLDLARKEHARQSATATGWALVNLSRIAREAIAAVIPLAQAANRNIDVVLPDSLTTHGRPDDLRDMMHNLLDNALVHGRGTIRVAGAIAMDHKTRQILMTISDEGDGVPAALQGEMFNRFRKGRPDSPGHGLGLAIVREVVAAHGGTISFLSSAGCELRIVLPSVEDRRDAKSS